MAVLSEKEVEKLHEGEALDEARDVAGSLEIRINQVLCGELKGEEARNLLAQDASNLRLKVKVVKLPGLSSICQRLDDYLWNIDDITDQNVRDIQQFADKILGLLDGPTEPKIDVAAEIRNLPHHTTFDVSEVKKIDKEVTLVLPQKSAARLVGRELTECGYRVTTVLDSLEAFEIILESRPDLVITTAVMPRLSGIDLACALKAMPTTRDVAVALLTSMDLNHPDLRALPMTVGIIRRGENFGADLAEVLQRFGIT
ncbi:response regulator [Luteithermobacter gelatinilyticus]|uniref:response regulator n=1 Tax=Luteithermobacter gelatinilyticus TaxID=2582913 RepID=UPI0011057EC8|nr:response regulator [Luteithermobacter gelatinilyticus]|tara:strand:- start:9532 stop:10302 length:771 start_codon:yes stop_codon:yes gene_type:complete